MKLRILVVEDEAIVARDLQQQLLELGYEPLGPASQGEEAIAQARALRPDLVLMDIQLAGAMDGVAAAQAIRDQLALPVVYLTAFAENETVARARVTEPFGYILKPFSERELHTVIEIALYKHRAELKLKTSEQQLRTIFETEPECVKVVGPAGELLEMNAAGLAILEAGSVAEINTRTLGEFIAPEHQAAFAALHQRVMNGETGLLEFEVTGLRGTRRWLETHAAPIRDGSGAVAKLLGVSRDITARRQAERNQRLSDQALAAVSQGVLIAGPDRRMVRANAAFTAMTGYTQADMLGQTCGLLQGPRTDPATVAAIRQALDNSGEFSGEILNYRKDGTPFWNELTISPAFDAQGRLANFIGISRDVTARRQAAAALQHRADFLASLNEIVRDLLHQRELSEQLPAMVRHAETIFQTDHCELLLKEGEVLVCRAACHRAAGEQPLGAILVRDEITPAWAVLTTGQPLHTRLRAGTEAARRHPRLLDAHSLHVPIALGRTCLAVLSLIRLEVPFSSEEAAGAGQLANAFALALHEAQVRAKLREDVLRQELADQLIKDGAKRLTGIIDSALDGIITVNSRQQIVLFNPAAAVIFRLPQAEALGQPLDRFIPAPFRGEHRKDVERYTATGEPARGMAMMVIALRADGEAFHAEVSLSRVVVGGETLSTAVVRDVSARERVEREKAAIEAQLRQSQKLDAIGQLAGGIAHDFNNLLTAILGSAAMLQDGRPLAPAVAQDLLQQISQAGNRAAALTRQLLVFSRRTEPVRQDVDLNQILTEMLKMLRRLVGEHIDLQIAFAAVPQPVNADPGMLDQVLLNLAVNARDAMPEGGKLTITTSAATITADAQTAALSEARGGERRPASSLARAGEFTVLTVSDQGVGMSREVQEKIFEPFFTTKEAGKGTGLGLATVFGIVQQHQGWIEVESHVGAGSTFRVYLPRLTAASPTAAPVAPPAPAPAAGRGETILLVEDESSVRNLLRIVLERAGYKVHECASGAAALALWPKHRDGIDLLLTDLVMPGGVSGVQLAQRLLAEKPGLRVIVMSGYSVSLSHDRKKLDVEVQFLPKPFDLDNVLATVRTWLDKKNTPRQ